MISRRFSLLFIFIGVIYAQCPAKRPSDCLGVFSHAPSHLPKCYCNPSRCNNSRPEDFAHTCPSGQLHEDACGLCLVCARARGQRCGGAANRLGICAGGLACKVRNDGRDDRAGVCVDVNDPECPTSENKARSFQCRPGRTGILAEALYCPQIQSCDNDRVTTTRRPPTTTRRPTTRRPRPQPTAISAPNRRPRPTLIETLLGTFN